jgi:hypothetical protein
VHPASETVSALSWMLHNFTELPPSLLQNLSCGRWQSTEFMIIDSRVGEKCNRTRPIIIITSVIALEKICSGKFSPKSVLAALATQALGGLLPGFRAVRRLFDRSNLSNSQLPTKQSNCSCIWAVTRSKQAST